MNRKYREKVYHPEAKETLVSGAKTSRFLLKRFLKRRSGIEPVIGYMKQKHSLGVNYLESLEADTFNPIMPTSA